MSRPVIRFAVSLIARARSRFRPSVLVWFQPSRLIKLFIGLVATLVVAYLYVFFSSAGRLYSWNAQTNYFDLLAEGLRAGHLHLSVEPSPKLLAMSDPTDSRHESLWLWDVSLFRGHYYLYWGPVPAILLAIVKSLLRTSREIPDAYLVGFFMLARFLVGAMLIRAMAEEFSARASSWTTKLAIVLWALANPIPFFLARGAVYEVAIASGQAFLIAGVYCAFRSLCLSRHPTSRRWLILAGVCWGLSIGSRWSLAAAIVPLVVLSAGASWRIRERRLSILAGSRVRGLKDLVSVGAPVVASLFLLGLYNYARFDSWTDTGLHYQLTTMKFGWKPSFIFANLYSYFVRPLKLTCRFPFLDAPADWTSELPRWVRFPEGYSWHESSAGILVSAPWTCLAVLASVYLVMLLLRPMVRRRVGLPVEDSVNWIVLFCVAAALILATTPAAATLGMWLATMRYQADYSSGLMLLGTIGCWLWVHRLPWRRLRSVGAAACAFVGAVSIIVGLLLGFRGYYNQFERNNPRLYQEFARFNFCPVEPSSGKNPMAMSDGQDSSGPSGSGR
jgi:hypothetical protein